MAFVWERRKKEATAGEANRKSLERQKTLIEGSPDIGSMHTDKSGQLSSREFNVAMQSIGFKGNINKALAEMDESGNGQTSIHEFDAKAGELFEKHEA